VESESGLLLDVAVAFAVALAGGWLAMRLRLPAIVGYIAGGLFISPFTPGFVGDIDRLRLIADIGVVLLLFAVGVQVTLADLRRGGVRSALIATLSSAAVLAGAFAVAPLAGWSAEEAAYAGAAVSICSSVVLITLLERRGEIASEHGRTAIAISVVQDLIAVILIIVLEAVTEERGGGIGDAAADTALAGLKAVAFITGLLFIGVRVTPFVLNRIAEERSRELFFLAVAALVIGTALASEYAGLSLALGAFLAGIVVSESDLSHRVLGELLPVRDVFAVLFFVTAGMLVDPSAVVGEWRTLLAISGLILAVRPAIVAGLLLAARVHWPASLMTAALVTPAAEFTFLLAGSGLDGGVLSEDLFSAILTGAVVSIVLSPLIVAGVDRLSTLRGVRPAAATTPQPAPSRLGRKAIICGYNAVGQTVASVLHPRFEVVVIEEDRTLARRATERGLAVIEGSPTSPAIIEHAGLEDARVVVIALADPFATRLFAERARVVNPYADILARAVVRSEAAKLQRSGIADAVVAEDEVAFELARHGLHRFGLSSRESLAIIQQYRARARLAV